MSNELIGSICVVLLAAGVTAVIYAPMIINTVLEYKQKRWCNQKPTR